MDNKNFYDFKVQNEADESKINDSSSERKEAFMSWLKELGIVLLIVFAFNTFIGQLTLVDGSSMTPTLENSDRLFVEKISKKFGDMNRYDVVVFEHAKNELYIKRVIGLPNDSIDIVDGRVYVNDKMLDSKYQFEEIQRYGDTLPIVVPEDEYFVLGDNRNGSHDSRSSDVGTVKSEAIVGKAVFRIWPLSKIGPLE